MCRKTPCSPFFLSLAYGALLVYASLMPFDFTLEQDFPYQLHLFFSQWPFNPYARISGSDVVSNLLLYIPLGWLLALNWQLAGLPKTKTLLRSLTVCAAASLMVETSQIFIISRTASASDWLLNTISGCIGAAAGIAYGKNLWLKLHRYLKHFWQQRPINILIMILIALLAADAWAPFLPTILLAQVWRNLKRSHFNLLAGLALHPWHWWLMTKVMVYAVLTSLLALWPEQASRRERYQKAALMAAGIAFSLEFTKPMIVSRSINIANVTTSLAGIISALLLEGVGRKKQGNFDLPTWGIVLIPLYILYLAWTPFNFTWNPDHIHRAMTDVYCFIAGGLLGLWPAYNPRFMSANKEATTDQKQ